MFCQKGRTLLNGYYVWKLEFLSRKMQSQVQAHYVGLRTPRFWFLFFYEKRNQKRIKEEVSSLISPRGGSIPRGCRKAAKPPPLVKNSRDRRGTRDLSAVTAGAQPPGISKGCPLRHVFGYFYREIKVPAVWSA